MSTVDPSPVERTGGPTSTPEVEDSKSAAIKSRSLSVETFGTQLIGTGTFALLAFGLYWLVSRALDYAFLVSRVVNDFLVVV